MHQIEDNDKIIQKHLCIDRKMAEHVYNLKYKYKGT